MNFIHSLKSFLAFGFLVVFSSSGLFAQEDSGGYLFYGSEASARSGKSYFPIIGMDKRKIHVDLGTKLKKVPANAACQTRLALKVSDRFVEVLELDYDTASMTNLQRSSNAVADMQLAGAQSEAEIALLDREGGASRETKINEIRQENNEFQERMKRDLDDGNFELEELADTVYVKGEFLPQADVPGAYCIVVVTSQRQDFTTREYIGKVQGARAKYLGDLTKGRIYKLKARCALGEFSLRRAEYQLHLFSETGEQVAMSNSRGLRTLTGEEFQKLDSSLGRSNRR